MVRWAELVLQDNKTTIKKRDTTDYMMVSTRLTWPFALESFPVCTRPRAESDVCDLFSHLQISDRGCGGGPRRTESLAMFE
jgi:hypothetical protein